MSLDAQKIRINSLTDRLNFAVCTAASTGLAIGLAALSVPEIPISAAMAYTLWTWREHQAPGMPVTFPTLDLDMETEELRKAMSEKLAMTWTPELVVGFYHNRPEINHAGADEGHIYLTYRLTHDLSPEERNAVMAHEMAHMAAKDMAHSRALHFLRFATGASVAGVLLKESLLAAAGGPGLGAASGVAAAAFLGTHLLYVATKRRFEYRADRIAAELTDPLALRDALIKLDEMPYPSLGEQWAAVKESFTERDLSKAAKRAVLSALFIVRRNGPLRAAHPPTQKRVKRLEQM